MGLFKKSTNYDKLSDLIFQFTTDCSLSTINILYDHGIRSKYVNADNSDLFFFIYVQSRILQNYTILYGDKKANKFVDHYINKLTIHLFKNLHYREVELLEKHMDNIELDIFNAIYYNKTITPEDNPALRLCKVYLKYVVSGTTINSDIITSLIKEFELQHTQVNNICYNNKI